MLDRPEFGSAGSEFDRAGSLPTPVKLVTRPELTHKDVIERLESALELARKGEVVGVAVAYVSNDGAIGTGFSRCEQAGMLMGAVALLQHRLCSDA